MYRGQYVPVAGLPYPFLAAVDVFQLGLVGGTNAESPSSIVVNFVREGEGEDHSWAFPLRRTIVP